MEIIRYEIKDDGFVYEIKTGCIPKVVGYANEPRYGNW